uniref:Gamma-interferon-inducible lysosomal thiol reductase n=1 Tax=Kalanchoe fedtschenkoi TaxID=63787 RepID=A0A7N0TH26_KALFE
MAADRISPLLLLLFLAAVSAAASARLLQPGPSSEKVNLALYYESLCQGSSGFIVDSLHELVEDDEMINIVDLELVPYGNAQIDQDGTVVCQHGEWECKLNKVEACAIDALPGVKGQFSFIFCVEDLVNKGQYTEWEQCLSSVEVDPEPITNCYSGQRGDELIALNAAKTGALKPPHEFVPWVTVKEEPLYYKFEDYIEYVCKAYKGPNRPAKCSQHASHKSTPRNEGSSDLKACPRQEA